MTDHYFEDQPDVPDRRRDVSATVWGRQLAFETSAGVFSHDGLDHATALLLAESAPPSSGRLLDLGCGWGPIACSVAAASPDVEVWAIDVNERALALTTANAARLDATVRTSMPDDVPTDLSFDAIWSNPPIRIGKPALHDLLLRWLPRLTPDGTARLVVGKNLGADSLQRWLSDQGWAVERVTSSRGFRILQIHRT